MHISIDKLTGTSNISLSLTVYFIFYVALFFCVVPSSMAKDSQQILIIHSYSQHYPWTKLQHDGFVATLNDSELGSFVFSTEHLDIKRLNYDESYKQMFSSYLESKYENFSPSLIYVTDDAALNFAASYLPDYLQSAPVIFSGVNNYEMANALDAKKFVGVVEKKDIASNIDLLSILDENVRDVLVISDASATYDSIKRELQKVLKTRPKMKVKFIEEKYLEPMLTELKQRSEKYLILTTIDGMISAEDRSVELSEVLKKIIALKKFIIISMEDAFLSDGILGGHVTDGDKQGQQAGQLAQAYFAGQSISTLTTIIDPINSYVFDYQLLEKYKLTLPEQIKSVANILNKPTSWYERFRTIIVSLCVALIFTIILILVSFVWTLSRKNKEILSRTQLIESKEQLEIERLQKVETYQEALVELSRGNFGCLDDEFGYAAKISAETLGIKQVGIWLYNNDHTDIVRQTIYVLGSGQQNVSATLHRVDFPTYFDAVDSGCSLAIDNASIDPITAELNEVYLAPNNITSMLDVPIFYQGQCMGVVCHEHIGDPRNWTPDEQEFAYAVAKNVSLSFEISKRKEIEAVLEHQAYHDALTNLPNRTLLIDRLDQAILQASRERSLVAILFFDLDNFKMINDSFGHVVGDKVLIKVSQLLRAKFREMDTIARIGGDEFVMILGAFKNVNQMTAMTSSIYDMLQSAIDIDGHQLYVTASIGVSVYPNDGASSEELIKNADAAMYHAKEAGKNSFQFYAQEMTDRAIKRIQIGSALRKAIVNEEFVVHYQPQYDVELRKLIGFEALVRWQHPEQGLLLPCEFIDIAEEIGLIVQIDRFVLVYSLRLFKKWRQQGLDVGKLSLNLSTRQLDEDNFYSEVSNSLQDNDFRPQWLTFEVTESSIMKNPKKAICLLEKLGKLGISIAIDDFGTGYSSLEYLKRLPVDKLKIDKSFVQDILKDEDDAQIVQAVIALSKSLKLKVLAEGVEEVGQMNFLLVNGCSEVQGYLYGRPMDVATIEESLSRMINFDIEMMP
jgi:diguanylate cyclase (GGDEF)-like protein